MRIRAAHDVAVRHIRQLHIVHVVAFALDEAQILLALDGMAHATDLRRCLEDHLFCLPAPACRQHTARL